jgi:hypothetical protein
MERIEEQWRETRLYNNNEKGRSFELATLGVCNAIPAVTGSLLLRKDSNPDLLIFTKAGPHLIECKNLTPNTYLNNKTRWGWTYKSIISKDWFKPEYETDTLLDHVIQNGKWDRIYATINIRNTERQRIAIMTYSNFNDESLEGLKQFNIHLITLNSSSWTKDKVKELELLLY